MDFKKMTNSALAGAIKDIGEALKVSRTWNDGGKGEGKYSDQMAEARGEQYRRENRDVCPHCDRPL